MGKLNQRLVIAAVLMASVVLLIFYLQFSRVNQLLENSATQYVAIERVQLEVVKAHLYWEQMQSHQQQSEQRMRQHMALAAQYMEALQRGGRVMGLTIAQIDTPDPELRTLLLTLKHSIYQFAVWFDAAAAPSAASGAAVEPQLEPSLETFFGLVDQMERALVAYQQADADYYSHVSRVTLGLSVLFLVAYLSHILRDQRQLASHISQVKKDHHRVSAHNQKLNFMAYHDPLTSLPNREHFRREFEFRMTEVSRERMEFALVFIDMDRFKQINDQLGHQVGDELLIAFSNRLRQQIREHDFVARLGGDEFVLIIVSDSRLMSIERQASMIANRVLEMVMSSFKLSEHEVTVGASLGIACYPKHTHNPDKLIKYADDAMYRAKQQGRNQICFYS